MSVSLPQLLNMKKVILAAVVAASFAAPQAFAQAKNFEGFSVAGGLNVATTKWEKSSSELSGTSTNGLLEAQYAAALGDKFVLAAGANLGLGDLKVGTGGAGEIKVKEMSSFFVKPGYAVSNDVLVYGKLAAVSATGEDSSAKISLSGTGYGFGVQVLSGKNVYYQAEFLQTKFDEKIGNKFSGSAVSFGIGYKF